MNIDNNLNETPDQLDDKDEPTVVTPDTEDNAMASDYPERDILDILNETAEQISDADIEDRLRQTLHRGGYSYQVQDAGPEPSLLGQLSETACLNTAGSQEDKLAELLAAFAGDEAGPAFSHTAWKDWEARGLRPLGGLQEQGNFQILSAQAEQILTQARAEARLLDAQAREQAERITAEARDEADEALNEAAKIIRDAREQAHRIISEARRDADQIREDTRDESLDALGYLRDMERRLLHAERCSLAYTRELQLTQFRGEIEKAEADQAKAAANLGVLVAAVECRLVSPNDLVLLTERLAAPSLTPGCGDVPGSLPRPTSEQAMTETHIWFAEMRRILAEAGEAPDGCSLPTRMRAAPGPDSGNAHDEETLARARAGDTAAWEQLLARYGRVIWSITRTHRLQENDAADVFQTTWMLLIENIDRIKHPDHVRPWLVKTAHRECLRTSTEKNAVHDGSADHDGDLRERWKNLMSRRRPSSSLMVVARYLGLTWVTDVPLPEEDAPVVSTVLPDKVRVWNPSVTALALPEIYAADLLGCLALTGQIRDPGQSQDGEDRREEKKAEPVNDQQSCNLGR